MRAHTPCKPTHTRTWPSRASSVTSVSSTACFTSSRSAAELLGMHTSYGMLDNGTSRSGVDTPAPVAAAAAAEPEPEPEPVSASVPP